MKHALVAVFSAVVLLSCATPQTREQALVSRAVEAMGGADALASIKTITFKGSSKFWEPEQSDIPGGEPRFAVDAPFEGIADTAGRAIRIDWDKNMAYIPRTFKYSEIVTPTAGYVIGVDSSARNAQSLQSSPPAHTMSGLRLAAAQRELLRGAVTGLVMAMHRDPEGVRPAGDIVVQGRSLPAVSYRSLIVAFDPQTGLPERVRTLDYDSIWGDVNFDYVYSQWRDIGGVKVPLARKYELNGRMVQEISFADVRLNQPIDTTRLQIPAAALAGAAKPATGNVPHQWVLRRQYVGFYMDSEHPSYDTRASQGLRLQEIAPGVHHVVGGTHNSLLVEMSDHLIVIDTPITDWQSRWVVNAAKEKFPNKPIRWVVLTHHHNDHAGGLRGYLAEGGTLVVGQGAGQHFRRVLSAPMTRNPDMRPYDFNRTPILEVPESHVMSDARGRQVIVYVMDNPHAKGMLMAWVPDAKLGFVTDVWSPGPPLPAKPNPGLVSVVNAVKKAGIQPERFAGGHGSTAEYASLARLAGR
jgi:glyoxylase-like metal-dependent hydrolase (beta-lactamase superfamily II)